MLLSVPCTLVKGVFLPLSFCLFSLPLFLIPFESPPKRTLNIKRITGILLHPFHSFQVFSGENEHQVANFSLHSLSPPLWRGAHTNWTGVCALSALISLFSSFAWLFGKKFPLFGKKFPQVRGEPDDVREMEACDSMPGWPQEDCIVCCNTLQ